MKNISISRKNLYLAISIFALGNIVTSTAPAEENILPAISRPEVLLPPDSDELSWRYNMKMGDFSGSCAGYVYDLTTPELIDWRIAQMKKEGLNTIIVSGFHFHQCFLERWPDIVEYLKLLTRKAHENEMKVIFHHSIQLLANHGTGLNNLITHTNWLQRDVQYDKPIFTGFCLNNPDFRKEYFTRIENLIRKTGIDGAMLDDLRFVSESCGCRYCRDRFTQETGLTLPKGDDSKVFFNEENPLWKEWLKWRKKSLADWWVAMRKMLNTVNPNFCLMIYTTHQEFTSTAPLRLGYDIFDCARGCDFLCTEINSRNVYDSYRAVFAYRKVKAGLGNLYGSPMWGLIYHIGDPVCAYFGWAMNHMNRQTTWMSTIAGENMSRYLAWPNRMNSRYADSMSDVAVVFSKYVRDFDRLFVGTTDVLGTSQCLSDAHIQHDIIMNDALLDASKLSKYKLLILPCVSNMSEKEVQALRQYVAGGGTLFVSGQTSLLDENGFKQQNFQLADVMGVDNSNGSSYVAPITIRMDAEGKNVNIPYSAPVTIRTSQGKNINIPYSATKIKAHNGAKILGEFIKNGETLSPAIVSNTYGKGECLYSAIPLGIPNNQPEDNVYHQQEKMDFEKNQVVFDFYMSLVKDITHDNLDFKSVEIPEKVLVSVYKQNVNDKKEILIHLLNATGTGLKKGDVITRKSNWAKRGNPFPPLLKDIVFDIRAGSNVSSAVIVSPDYKDERPVAVEKKENGYFRLTVKKEDLKAYSIVYLKLLNN